jgi:hypothetical protein
MVAIVVLLLILALFGGLGFAAHILWLVLIAAVILWLVGFLIGGVEGGIAGNGRGCAGARATAVGGDRRSAGEGAAASDAAGARPASARHRRARRSPTE